MGHNPPATVKHLLNVVNTKVGEVDICQSGEAGEDEDVAYLIEPCGREIL